MSATASPALGVDLNDFLDDIKNKLTWSWDNNPDIYHIGDRVEMDAASVPMLDDSVELDMSGYDAIPVDAEGSLTINETHEIRFKLRLDKVQRRETKWSSAAPIATYELETL